MRPYWIRVGPKSNESALVSDGKEDAETQTGRKCEDGGRY